MLLAGHLVGYGGVVSTSQPMEARREDGSLVSLADALRGAWPALQLPSALPAESPAPQEGAGSGALDAAAEAAETAEVTPSAAATDDRGPAAGPRAVRVLIDGVPAPLELPIAWLHARMHAADHFLYVTVHAL